MHIEIAEQDRTFRKEVRAFFRERLPGDVRDKVRDGSLLTREDVVGWMRTVSDRGWMCPNWPEAAGGPGWTPSQKFIFEEESYLACAPGPVPFGPQMVGPVLLAFGTDEQKARHLPGILSSEVIWCQGYSEPNSGSDLASLGCRAVRDGDRYIVNGRKIWTTNADWADWCFALVRTDSSGKKQDGISVLLIDMSLPGVTVRPIERFSRMSDFNEVIFEDVRVPVSERVHDEGKGWTCAKYLLGHERSGTAGVGLCRQRLDRLEEIDDGRDPAFSRRIAETGAALEDLRWSFLRMVAAKEADDEIGPEASLLKIRGTEIQQDVMELLMEAQGYFAHPFIERALAQGWNEPPVGPSEAAGATAFYFDWRKASIYGGSNEIQRNIIAKAVLGL